MSYYVSFHYLLPYSSLNNKHEIARTVYTFGVVYLIHKYVSVLSLSMTFQISKTHTYAYTITMQIQFPIYVFIRLVHIDLMDTLI